MNLSYVFKKFSSVFVTFDHPNVAQRLGLQNHDYMGSFFDMTETFMLQGQLIIIIHFFQEVLEKTHDFLHGKLFLTNA